MILNLRISRTFDFGGRTKEQEYYDMDGFQSVFGDASSGRRYSLTVAASAHNLLNTVNADNPVGVLASPLFLRSQALASYWGPAGESANRRIVLQLRFGF